MNRVRIFTTSALLSICLILSAQTVTDIHKNCYSSIRSKKYDEAKEAAQKLLERTDLSDAERSETYYIIGYSNRKKNLFAESLEFYEKAILATSSNDKKAQIYNNIIGSLIYMNLNNEAIQEANKAIKLSELWSPVSYYNKSIAQIKIEDYAAASETLEAGLKVCDKLDNQFYKAKIYNQYGLMEKELFEYSGLDEHAKLASQYFGYVLDIQDNKVEQGKAHHYLAELNLLMNDTTSAVQQFEYAIDNQSNSQYLFHALRDYSSYLLSLGNSLEAKPLVDTALAIFPSITLTGETLKIFFTAQDMGYDVPLFRNYFDAYVEQRDKTEAAYAAYIGRQIKRDNALKVKQRVQMIVISLSVIVIITLMVIAMIYRRKITSSYKFIKKFESYTTK